MKNGDELYQKLAEGSRQRLAEGTWPEVMMVFGYTNPRALRTSEEEFDWLKAFYAKAICPNAVAFLEEVRMKEKEYEATMSFNLSLCHRSVSGKTLPTTENVNEFFYTPDMLIGTRRGIEGATVWFRKLADGAACLPPEALQVFDKIFGEAIKFLKEPWEKMGVEEMVREIAKPDNLN